MKSSQPNIVIVTRETRLSDLRARWASPSLAKFRIEKAHAHEEDRRRRLRRREPEAALAEAQAAAAFEEYAAEADVYAHRVAEVRAALELGLPVKLLDRQLVPTFDFWNTAVVVVVGQDGLVANTAKYVGDTPIVGVNPDPQRFDGVLLPFGPEHVHDVVQRVLAGRFKSRRITLAEVNLNDGQRLLAFNDFFVGSASHVSARYTLEVGGRAEAQISSGVLISTGAGATGWMSSVFNRTAGIARLSGTRLPAPRSIGWEERVLCWAVREPFRSRQSGAELVMGLIDEGEELVLESLMPASGVIFSDGIERDALEFNSGAIATVAVSSHKANLVIADRGR
jgi:hypothetical protein